MSNPLRKVKLNKIFYFIFKPNLKKGCSIILNRLFFCFVFKQPGFNFTLCLSFFGGVHLEAKL